MELRILSGLHRGAVLDLDDTSEPVTLGAAPEGDLDVLLVDAGVADRHCRLLLQPDGWHIEPLQGLLFDADGHNVATARPLLRGRSLRLAGVWFALCDAADPWPDVPPGTATPGPPAAAAAPPPGAATSGAYPRPRLKGPGIALAVCALAVPAAWFATTAYGRAARTAAPAQAPAPAQTATPAALPSAQLASAFTRALAERDLTDRLDVHLEPGRWEIRGSLDDDERQRFERLLSRFTDTHKPRFPIKVSLVTPAELLPFRVVEVITGKGAGIVTDSGERLHTGEALQGWRLVAIEPGRIVFQGRRRVEVLL